MKLKINRNIEIPESELVENFIHSSGPGGQNVNKVATAVQLRYDAANSEILNEEIKSRLKRIAGKRMTADGVLVIEAKRYRAQEKNRRDARERLAALIRRAVQKPQARKKTAPSLAARRRRLEGKKRRALKKKQRITPESDDY